MFITEFRRNTQRTDVVRVCGVLDGNKLLVWRDVRYRRTEQKEYVEELDEQVTYWV